MREMDEFRSTYRSYGGDWKFEVVNSRGYSSNQMCGSPDPPRGARISSSTSTSTSNHNYPYTSSSSSSSSSSSWTLKDPEMKRRKRVAAYKAYSVEGKMKASLRHSFRWFKNKYSTIVHGY